MLDDDNDPSTSDMPQLIVDSDSDSDEDESDMTDGDESEEEDIDDMCRNLEWSFDKAHLCSSIKFEIESVVTEYAKMAIRQRGHTAFGIFQLFFTKGLADEIAKQTNLYARQVIENQAQKTCKPPRYWLDTTAEEIYKFIGVSLAMAQNPRKGGFRVYWRSDVNGGLVGHNFGRFMSLRRYTDLRKYLHFNDNSEDEQKSDSQPDKIRKIRIVVDTFNSQSKKNV